MNLATHLFDRREMFGLNRRMHRRTLDKRAAQQLRALGEPQIMAEDVIRKIRELYKETRFTNPDDVVSATPMAYTVGLNHADVRRHLHAAAALAHITGTSYEYMAQILTRIATQGLATGQEIHLLRAKAVPLWVLSEGAFGHAAEQGFLDQVRAGEITYEDIISSVLHETRGLEI